MGRGVRQVCPTRGPAVNPEGWTVLSDNPAHVRFFFLSLISKMYKRQTRGKTLHMF